MKNPWRTEHPGQFSNEEKEVVHLAESGEIQQAEMYIPTVKQYWAPFNYPNIHLELGRTDPYVGAEFNYDGVELDVPPYGAITVSEDEPIVGVAVIGSACVPPGFVIIHAEPVTWKYPRTAVKMRIDGLWGGHIRIDPWLKGIDEGYKEAGMSSAIFEIPESRKVTIYAGSQMDLDEKDLENMRHDTHYSIRIIRVTLKHAKT